MKKGIFLFFLLGIMSYGKNISLDTMLKELDEKSYNREIYEIQNKINSDKEKYYKLDDFNGVETSATSNYSNREDAFEITGRIQYGPIYFEGTKNYNSEDEAVYGIEKSLKDLIYSESKNQLKQLEYTKEIDRIDYKKNLETQKIDLLNLYKEYKNSELEIAIKKSGIEKLSVEEKKMKKSYELGAVAKIELDSIQYSIKNMQLEIDVLKRNLLKLKEKFAYDFGIEIGDNSLQEIVPPSKNFDIYVEEYGKKDIELLEFQKRKIEENIKYLNYDNTMPDITLGVEHSNKYDENRVVLKFSKKLFEGLLMLKIVHPVYCGMDVHKKFVIAAMKDKKKPYFKVTYDCIKKRRDHNRAIIAIARMILICIYHMFLKKEVFSPTETNYSDIPEELYKKHREQYIKNTINVNFCEN